VSKPFSIEFRRDVIAVARQGDQSIAQVAGSFGISESCLNPWLKIADREDGLASSVSPTPAAGGSTGLVARFERQVNPDGSLEPAERARRVESARKAHMKRLALKSAKAPRRRAEANRRSFYVWLALRRFSRFPRPGRTCNRRAQRGLPERLATMTGSSRRPAPGVAATSAQRTSGSTISPGGVGTVTTSGSSHTRRYLAAKWADTGMGVRRTTTPEMTPSIVQPVASPTTMMTVRRSDGEMV
jgi:transposase-like protein